MTALLDIQHLTTIFETSEGQIKAADNLDFFVDKREVLGVVGESGSGKSMTALSILRLVPPPGHITGGKIFFEGEDLLTYSENKMRQIRGNRIALIPQDPMTSLNPVYTIGSQIMEAIELHQAVSRKEARLRTIEVLEQVQMPQAASRIDDYPHQFSGGMRQRVMIAMALSCKPRLLIADEPTTALDVTIQAQILELLRCIQRDQGMSIILITHDLGVVAEMCHRVAVMYAGAVVELASVHDLFEHAKHPYTVGLLNSLPKPETTRLQPIIGQPPNMANLPSGCRFAPRCPLVELRCWKAVPLLEEKVPGQFARCIVVPAQMKNEVLH